MPITLAEKIIRFNRELEFSGKLPPGIKVLNPFRENPEIARISEKFYRKFYDDLHKRKMIIGINPGRLGAGATGIPFTDTKRLKEKCGISIHSVHTHEPSSVFMYELIDSYGGPDIFYHDFYINSVSPLGFVKLNSIGNRVNCNYYDFPFLFETLKDFITENLKKQIRFGFDTSICYALGIKNARFLSIINKKEKFFDRIIPLEHPRYIVQYRKKEMNAFADRFVKILKGKLGN